MAVIKKSIGEKVFTVFNITFMILLSVSILYPILNVISMSFSGFGSATRNEVTFYPKDITLESYIQIFESRAILNAYINSIIITVLGTFFGVILTSFVAYPLSRSKFMGRRFFTLAIALTLWFNAGIIPTFMLVKSLGLYNTLAALIIPCLINTFYVIIMLTFFKELPNELIDAANIDGCNEFQTLFLIVYPISKPILATIGMWFAVAQWNNFLDPLIYLRDRKLYPLQIMLREVVLQGTASEYGISIGAQEANPSDNEFLVVEETLKAATVVISTLPIMCIYPFIQKHFAKGVMIGSIKG